MYHCDVCGLIATYLLRKLGEPTPGVERERGSCPDHLIAVIKDMGGSVVVDVLVNGAWE